MYWLVETISIVRKHNSTEKDYPEQAQLLFFRPHSSNENRMNKLSHPTNLYDGSIKLKNIIVQNSFQSLYEQNIYYYV